MGHKPGSQVQPGEGSKQLGEAESLSLHLALLCWGVVLKSRKPFILLPLTLHKSGNTSIHLCIQMLCRGERRLCVGWEEAGEANWLQSIWNLISLDGNAFSLALLPEDFAPSSLWISRSSSVMIYDPKTHSSLLRVWSRLFIPQAWLTHLHKNPFPAAPLFCILLLPLSLSESLWLFLSSALL